MTKTKFLMLPRIIISINSENNTKRRCRNVKRYSSLPLDVKVSNTSLVFPVTSITSMCYQTGKVPRNRHNFHVAFILCKLRVSQ